ncbi:MAG: transglycosylase SLT domain-containing protein [Parvularculaceae bacterium]
MRKAHLRRGLAGLWAKLALPALVAALICLPAAAMVSPRLKPPAPHPAYASRDEYARLNEVRAAIAQRNWAGARAAADKLADPVAHSLGEWFYFYAEDPKLDFRAAGAFLDTHPDWPALSRIQAAAEKRIPDNASVSDVLAFFDTRDPVTGEGVLQLARAQFATGEQTAAILHLREAWINQNFILSDEQKLLTLYGKYLTPEDHAARADRLLWDREVTAARRVFSRLDSNHRRMAEVRAALLLRAANAPDLYYALPQDQQTDPGVLLAAVRYYRRGKEEPRAVALALKAPADPVVLRNADRWWDERQLLMRWALTERRYTDAYSLAAGSGLEPGSNFAEAEFNAGWIALRFLNAPERAETHFRALANAVGSPISLARAYYWLGRAEEAKNDTEAANARYRVAASYIYTFYGQLAAEKLGGEPLAAAFAPPTAPSPADKARFSSRPVVAALRILSELDDDNAFLIFAYQADDQLETPGEYVELAHLAERRGATHIAVRAGKVGVGRNAFAAEVAYPLIFVPDEAARFAPPEIILGLSRQESEFNPRAYSRAGARGLMQLLPTTAQITARKEGLRYSRNALLDDPTYNLTIGSAHLSHLLTRFNGSRIMTFAAYNAGPMRVEEWVGRYGDPRSDDVDPIDWVEQIPFAETRNYVQRVLENTQVYRSRLTEKPIAGRLAADLEVGGASNRAGLLAARTATEALPDLPPRTAVFASAAKLMSPDPAPAAPAPNATQDNATNAGDTRIDTDAAKTATASESAAFIADDKPATQKKTKDARGRKKPSPALSEFLGTKPAPKEEPAKSPEDSAPAPTSNAIVALSSSDAPAAGDENDNTSSDAAPLAAEMNDNILNEEGAPTTQKCETYRAYISAADKDEASAGDLNAGMLAELKGGGSCGEDSAPSLPEDADVPQGPITETPVDE